MVCTRVDQLVATYQSPLRQVEMPTPHQGEFGHRTCCRTKCSILPPNILNNLYANFGNEDSQELRELFNLHRRTNQIIHQKNTQLASYYFAQIEEAVKTQRQPAYYVYTAMSKDAVPGKLILKRVGGITTGKSEDESAKRALSGAVAVNGFYWNVHKRNSIDGLGLDVKSTVHYLRKYPNAAWIDLEGKKNDQMIYGDGDGIVFTDFTKSLDVIGHELTHGVTQYSPAQFEYHNQAGALNEAMSDIGGAQVKHYVNKQKSILTDNAEDYNHWLIGSELLVNPTTTRKAIRSMSQPGTAFVNDRWLGTDNQPAKMGDYVELPDNEEGDWGGVHTNSGIINKAFVEFARNLAKKSSETQHQYSFGVAGKVFYNTLQSGLVGPECTFEQFAKATVELVVKTFKSGSLEDQALRDAWQTTEVLGMLTNTPLIKK